MKSISLLGCLLIISCFFTNCGGSDKYSGFPMDKKYWTADDYRKVNDEITYLNYNKEEFPNLDNPNTTSIFKKIVDTLNFSIVTNDGELGIKHRSEFATSMFDEYRNLLEKYSQLDRQDKYKYPEEVVALFQFGLALQVPYILLGNEKIIKDADNPQADDVVSITKRNGQVLISNYNLFLDYINYEDRFTEKALSKYAESMRDYFPRLITQIIPSGDYSAMFERVGNMLKKAKNTLIIQELEKIKSLLISKDGPKS